mmetsp:Transcript_11419/g.30824  ORF Transcript_11419/g.30824 Transcript_11419/m.30824 type:complete len:455 (-) Transcript_11419:114-1478(-)
MLSPLGGLPVGDARVVEPRGDEDAGVLLGPDLVDGAVGEHVVKVLWLVGVAPLLPLPRGEGDGGVAHGHHEVHERHPRQGGPEEVGRLVDHVAHEEAARRAPLAAHARGLGPPGLDQGVSHVHKVVEGVALREVLAAFLIPLPPPVLRPAAHVRDGVHHAAVHEWQRARGEGGLDAHAVGAVAVQVKRGGRCRRVIHPRTHIHLILPPKERHGHFGPVPCSDVAARGGVERGVVVGYGRLLDRGHLARVEVVGHGPARGHGRGEGEADGLGLHFKVGTKATLVGSLGPLHAVHGLHLRALTRHVEDPHLREPSLAALDHEVVLEARGVAHRALGIMRQNGLALRVTQRLPVLQAGRGEGRNDHLLIVRTALIGGDEEPVRAVLHGVAKLELARLDELELWRRRSRALGRHIGFKFKRLATFVCEFQEAHLGRFRRVGAHEEEAAVARLIHGYVE